MNARIEILPPIQQIAAVCCPRTGSAADEPPAIVGLFFTAAEQGARLSVKALKAILRYSTYARP